ncbi:MAG: hypothetical protein ABFS32_22175 [Bacteroidota bacterium]
MPDNLTRALVLINKDFDLDIDNSEVENHDAFLAALARVIQHLLDKDFERLINGLYRIDVSEEKVKQAFASQDNIAETIAKLIIERELQKVATREKYKS